MKILFINSVCGIGSTGRICAELADALTDRGHVVRIAYGRDAFVPEQYRKYSVRIGSDLDVRMHGIKARAFDASGFGSMAATRLFLEWVKDFDPDLIHLHNIHGYYIHVGELFRFLKTYRGRVLWTLHDCWAFTGHSSFCDGSGCEKWKNGCGKCPETQHYPKTYLDRSAKNWKTKSRLFTGVRDLTLITPSQWLADLVQESFLKEYPVRVVRNGIDTEKFFPESSDLREEYGIGGRKLILGVASVWEKRKGLDDLIRLAGELSEDAFKLVVIGVDESQMKQLPSSVIGIRKTHSVDELRRWYSAADVFVNPTTEDNYPSTNLEAIACGTPVITYDTGGSPESARLFGSVCEPAMESMKEIILSGEWVRSKGDTSGIDTGTFVKKMMEFYGEKE